jgi:hypothetical protein
LKIESFKLIIPSSKNESLKSDIPFILNYNSFYNLLNSQIYKILIKFMNLEKSKQFITGIIWNEGRGR